jgi:hypothetical protein
MRAGSLLFGIFFLVFSFVLQISTTHAACPREGGGFFDISIDQADELCPSGAVKMFSPSSGIGSCWCPMDEPCVKNGMCMSEEEYANYQSPTPTPTPAPLTCSPPYVKDGNGGCIHGDTYCAQQYTGMEYSLSQNLCICKAGYTQESHGVCIASCTPPYVKDGNGGCIHGDTYCAQHYTGMEYSQSQNFCVCKPGYTEESHGVCIEEEYEYEYEYEYEPGPEEISQGESCDPGYTIYTESIGCEPIYCGENASYDLNEFECFCDRGYILNPEGDCVKFVPETSTPSPTPAPTTEKDDQQKLEEAKEQKRKELEAQGVGKTPEKKDEKQEEKANDDAANTADIFENFGPLSRAEKLRRINSSSNTTFITSDFAKSLAQSAKTEISPAGQSALITVEGFLTRSINPQKPAEEVIADLKKSPDKSTSFTGNLLQNLWTELNAEEEDDSSEKSDLEVFMNAVGGMAENLKEQEVLGEKKADIIKKFGDGEHKDAILDIIRHGLERYAEGDGPLAKFTKKSLVLVEKIEKVGETIGKVKEKFDDLKKKYGDVKEKIDRVKQIGEDTHSARTELGGAAGDIQLFFIALREVGSEVVDHFLGKTIEKLPLGGLEKVPGDAAKLLLKTPAELGKVATKIHKDRIEKLERAGLGYEYSYQSDLRRFLDQKASHTLEKVGTVGDNRTVKKLTYKLDGKEQTIEYNLNAHSFVQELDEKGKPTGFIVATKCEGCLEIEGNVRFKIKDNTWLLGFGGSMEMELWTNENPPRRIDSIPYK